MAEKVKINVTPSISRFFGFRQDAEAANDNAIGGERPGKRRRSWMDFFVTLISGMGVDDRYDSYDNPLADLE